MTETQRTTAPEPEGYAPRNGDRRHGRKPWLDRSGAKRDRYREDATENDARSALGKLVANPVHLMLSDLNMPGMDGMQLLKSLRESKATQRIGFILVTGSPTPDARPPT